MKPFIKKISALALVFMLTAAVPVSSWAAEEGTSLIDSLLNQINELNNQNVDLMKQLEDAKTQSQTPAPTRKPVVYAPVIKLVSPQTTTVKRGEVANITVTLKNIGTSVANSVLAQAVPDAESPFTAELMDDSNNLGDINEGKTKEMRLRITVDENAAPGTAHMINLTYYYKDRNQNNLEGKDVIYVRIGGQVEQSPNVTISNFKESSTNIMPGDSITLTADIENLGGSEARNVQITLDGLKPESIYLTGGMSSSYWNNMAAGHSEKLTYTFKTTETARGVYPITFKITYEDKGGNKVERNPSYNVNVVTESHSARAQLEIRDITAPSGAVGVDQDALITMHIFNAGTMAAEEIKITAGGYDETAVYPKTSNVQVINSLAEGTGQMLTFTFAPTAAAKSQSYNVGFTVEYKTGYILDDGTEEVRTFQQYAAFRVNNPEKEEDEEDPTKTLKPKMIVSEYSVDPNIVKAGSEFNLHITFQNANNEKAVENIKITLEAVEYTEGKGAVFTPVDGSNTFYIDRIEPKGEEPRILRMFAVPDADPRTYNLKVVFNYQDEDYNDYTEQEQISVNVKQTTRLEMTPPELQESYMVGDEIYFWLNIINSGRVSLANLRVRLEGDIVEAVDAETDKFIGNLGRGNTASYEGRLFPLVPGEYSGALVVAGEDDTGEIVEFRNELSINVTEAPVFDGEGGMGGDLMGMPGMEFDPGAEGMEGGGEGFWAQALNFMKQPYGWGPAAGLVVVVIVIIVLVRRKKNKINFDGDEE